MNHRFILLLSILLFGLVHIRNAQAAGPMPGSPFPTQITSANGGGCIDAPLPQPANAEGGGVWFLQQFPCNSGANQHWSFQQTSSGSFVIQSTFNPGFCFDLPNAATAPNTRVQLFPCHGGPDQQWNLTRADGSTAEISPALAPGMVLDVADGIVREQAVIQLFPRQGSANQRWRFPVDGLPQGLTGGIAYVNHDCGPNAVAFAAAGVSAIGLIACAVDVGSSAWGQSCLQVIQGTSGTIAAGPGAFKSCGDPKVFRSGAVLAIGESNPVATLILDASGSSFAVHAAPGWLTMSDGDRGNDRNFGFYHQELSAPSASLSDTSVSDRFVLPKGTACGFHHTRNTAYNVMQRFNLGNASSCMGHDPAQRDCPTGWQARNHFDMSSGSDGACGDLNDQAHCDYFVWCEYEDPNGLCDADPNCLSNAHRRGFGFSVSSDTDLNGAAAGVFIQNPPANDGPCPVGWLRTNAYDDGRPAGQGLSWCHPWPDDLPQGLTAGMAYLTLVGPNKVEATGGVALGNQTPQTNGDGFIVRSDGDFGSPRNFGFYHQELGQGGVSDPALSDNLKLMKGAACGFHHTRNTPGLTCMGHDPAQRDCPNGWQARNHFDMSSGSDGACGDLNDQAHCGYFVWCEYQDPHGVCEGDAATDCGYWAKFIGYTMGIASNTDRNGTSLALGTNCPGGWSPRTPFFDMGRSSGQGLSWCMP
jgi:hypothetical protein